MRIVAWGIVTIVTVALGSACIVEGDVYDEDTNTVVIHQPAVANLPQWASQHTDELNTGVATPLDPDAPIDPCTCTTDECIQQWGEDTLACDVCVVVFCDGEPRVHHCRFCDPP